MKRREVIPLIIGALVFPLYARAQRSSKVWRVGYLNPGTVLFSAGVPIIGPWKRKMRELGYVEGQNLVVEERVANGNYDLMSGLAAELVALKPDAIIGNGTPAIAALQKLTSSIPLIMSPVADPVSSGFAHSLARPGGNITGVANMSQDYLPKTLELVTELVPHARRIGVLMSTNPSHATMYSLAEKAAFSRGVNLVAAPAKNESDLDDAFASLAAAKCDALIVLSDPPRPRIAALAAAARLPTIYQDGQYIHLGGLVGYGPDFGELIALSAVYVDKIFKGANPAEMPIEQPTTFHLRINLRAAKALGLTISPTLLSRADEVID
jgi:putative ABC transport system substrate-binding protein